MSQWFGNPGRKRERSPGRDSGESSSFPRGRSTNPGRAYKGASKPEGRLSQSGPVDDDVDDYQVETTDLARSIASADPNRLPEVRRPPSGKSSPSAAVTRVEIGRRAVALIIDLLACYLASVVIDLLPFINRFVSLDLLFMLLFLLRDFPFEGRGIGKNLMGLRVVDKETLEPPTPLQCFQRNIVPIAPFIVAQVVSLTLRLVPFGFVDHFVTEVVNIVGTVYVIIVLPLEGYRAYSRADGMRIGDELAGVTIIESNMDFSRPFPRD
jgi:uncharacterized RDD family membrane protein YckC